ncbi:MAG: hypothetical protein JO199_01365 [Candidatus Eremiobacteraeota bacterium]|nr:hypothetical protein [Candidatus Eremiobacteraeota bacterium]
MLLKSSRAAAFVLTIAVSACSAPTSGGIPALAAAAIRNAPSATHKLWVINANGTFTAYDPPYAQPAVVIGTAQGWESGADAIVVSKSGNVFVANCCMGTPASNVQEFAPPYKKPTVTITKGIVTPLWCAVTSKNWLIVANQSPNGSNGNLLVYKPPYTGQPASIVFKQFSPTRVLVGPQDELFVMYDDDTYSKRPGSVQIYKPPYTGKPVKSITTGFKWPTAMGMNEHGLLAVADSNGPQIEVFAPPYDRMTARITKGITGTVGAVVVAPNGWIAEADGSNRVSVWKPPYKGNALVQNPYAYAPTTLTLAFDEASNLFVPESQSMDVDVFGAPYTAKPKMQITNGVFSPSRLALRP